MDRRLADRAAGRIREVEPVIRLAVVVAGRPEPERDPQDEDAGLNQVGSQSGAMSGEKSGEIAIDP
jgi:hypothetical protein